MAVLNEVNRAYKESTSPMPPAPRTRAPEAVFEITRSGEPVPGARVFLAPAAGQGTEPVGVRADRAGRAWFLLEEPGEYRLTVEGVSYERKVTVARLPNELKAGLGYVPRIRIELGE